MTEEKGRNKIRYERGEEKRRGKWGEESEVRISWRDKGEKKKKGERIEKREEEGWENRRKRRGRVRE